MLRSCNACEVVRYSMQGECVPMEEPLCRCIYTDDKGKLRFWFAFKEALWHSVSQMLSINVFTVYVFSSRIVVAAYAFVVLIVSNTYLANLAAFLTVDQLDSKIKDVTDLWGKSVATFPTYFRRLEENHHITAITTDGAAPFCASTLWLCVCHQASVDSRLGLVSRSCMPEME